MSKSKTNRYDELLAETEKIACEWESSDSGMKEMFEDLLWLQTQTLVELNRQLKNKK